MMVRLAAAWHWEPEAEELWWRLANDHLSERQSLLELYHLYSLARNTRSLYQVSLRLYDLDRQNIVAANNVAALALLLKENLHTAEQLALDNYNRSPTNPVFVATHAFSLYIQKRASTAAQLLDRLPENYRSLPDIAAYYGIVLAANHDYARARKYLDLGVRARLLPEELQLVKEARASLPPP
jgi:predicted Zn-dependent protease